MESTMKVVVGERRRCADGVISLTLVRSDGACLPPWEAGAHIDVRVFDRASLPAMRQYSLCGTQEDARSWRIAVLDEPDGRGGSAWLHRHAQAGCELTVSSPRNNFPLHEGMAPAILVAGGIGITPILSMAHALKARGTPFSLHHFARTRSAAALADEVLAAPWSDNAEVTLDDDDRHTSTSLDERLRCLVTPQSHLYVCGPAGFMHAVVSELQSRGLPARQVHRELFAAIPRQAREDEAAAFEIQLRSDGRIIYVRPECSAIQALAAAGVDVVVSCEQGLCGSCLTPVLEGRPDHRDQFLLPEERERNDCFTPCCSRAHSPRLVLDL